MALAHSARLSNFTKLLDVMKMKLNHSNRVRSFVLAACIVAGGVLTLNGCSDQLEDIQTVNGVTSGSSIKISVAAGAEGVKAWYDVLASTIEKTNSASNKRILLLADWSNATVIGTVQNTEKVWLVPVL